MEKVDYILYSHVDPDHTMGIRAVEQLKMDWLKCSVGVKNSNPIVVATLSQILEDLKLQRTKYGSVLDYYEACNIIKTQGTNEIQIGDLTISMIPANPQNSVAIFVITEKDKKVIYAPCDVKPFPEHELFYHADVLIIGNTIVGDVLKNGFLLEKDNSLRDELFVMEEISEIKKKYHINEVSITHLEEDWGKSYDDYLQIEKQLQGIHFAFDGMEV